MPRYSFALFLAAACATSTPTPKEPAVAGKSVETADLDRAADPCTDFFQYSNGAWRAANPIPASMDRWSRRWAAGEQNKNQLRTILDDESKRHDWPKASIDQQISDFYGSCMDETRINALGITP